MMKRRPFLLGSYLLCIVSSFPGLGVAEGSAAVESTVPVGEPVATSYDACHDASASVKVQLNVLDHNGMLHMANFTVTGLPQQQSLSSNNASSSSSSGGTDVVYTKMQASQRQLSIETRREVVWHGMIAERGRFGFATLLSLHDDTHTSNNHITGTFTTDAAAFEFDGAIPTTTTGSSTPPSFRVRCTYWKNDEVEDVPLYGNLHGTNADGMGAASSVAPRDPSYPVLTGAVSVEPDPGGSTTVSMGAAATLWSNDAVSNRRLQETSVQPAPAPAPATTIKILVLVAHRALCESNGLERRCRADSSNTTVTQPVVDKIAIAERQTIVAMQHLDLTIRVVQIVFLEDDYDPQPNGDALDFLRKNHELQQLRNDASANLMLMVTGSRLRGAASGIGTLNGAESVVSLDGMAQFTFTHEIGHNLGARHDRQSTDNKHPYAHGLQVPLQFRTVMSYRCDEISTTTQTSSSMNVDSCPRVPFYSARDQFLNGIPLGDAKHDNARMIRENGPKVARWHSRPTCTSVLQSQKCPGQNLMTKQRLFIFCAERCVEQRFLFWRRLLGWRCGNC